jgi:hypothetical protein
MSGKKTKFVVVNTVPRNKPPPISPDLTLSDQLLEVLDATPAGMSDDKKTIEIVQFIKASLIRCGHDPSRIFTGGYQQEALIAAVLGKKPNKKAHGYDLTDENGIHTEIKTTNTALGKTANVNFAPPAVKDGESPAAYYERLKTINEDKGNVMVLHFWGEKGDINSANIYVLRHEFLSLIMMAKNAMEVENVNLGGIGCKKCTRIHRLDGLKELEDEWARDPSVFRVSKVNTPMTGGCKKPPKDEDEDVSDTASSDSHDSDGEYVAEYPEDDEEDGDTDDEMPPLEESPRKIAENQPFEKMDPRRVMLARKETPVEQAAASPLFAEFVKDLTEITWADLEMMDINKFGYLLGSIESFRGKRMSEIFWNRYVRPYKVDPELSEFQKNFLGDMIRMVLEENEFTLVLKKK